MSRLTNDNRETIRKLAIKATFKDRREALARAEHALGMEAYEAVFTDTERQQAAAMPDRWLKRDDCLRFNANGWQANLTVSPALPVPHAQYCAPLGSLTGDLADRVQAHLQAGKGLREEEWKAVSELDGFLAQFKTFKQLRDAWPEGEPFYASLDVDRPASGVPAVRVQAINELLNLAA